MSAGSEQQGPGTTPSRQDEAPVPAGGAPPDVGPTATISRSNLVRVVQTPLGFFVLVLLVVETMLGAIAGVSTGPDRTLAIQGILGIVAGLSAVVTALAVCRPEAIFGKRPVTTAPPAPGDGLRLRPDWRSIRVVDGEEIHARWTVTQRGESVTAKVKATAGPYKGMVYNYVGTFRDRILTLMYAAANPHLPDRGTLTLKLSAAGDVLDGYLSFYSTAHDRVEVCPYRCEAAR